MNSTKRLLPSALGPLLAALSLSASPSGVSGSPGDLLRAIDREGASATYTIELGRTDRLVELSIVANGEDQSDMVGAFEETQSSTLRITLQDDVLRTENGRARLVERHFASIEGEVENRWSDDEGSESETLERSSPLEGLAVHFEPSEDPEEARGDARFAEPGSGDEEWLEGLTTRVDLALLLPPDDVASGDTWSVDPARIRELIEPAGELPITTDADEAWGAPEGEPTESFDGEIELEYRGTRDDSGRRVGVVRVAVDVTIAMDLSDMTGLAGLDGDEGYEDYGGSMELDVHDVETTFEGEGELRWDVDAGCLVSFRLDCETESIETTVGTYAYEGESEELEQEIRYAGTMSVRVERTE